MDIAATLTVYEPRVRHEIGVVVFPSSAISAHRTHDRARGVPFKGGFRESEQNARRYCAGSDEKIAREFFRVRSTLLARIFELPQTSTWKWTEPTMKPVKRLDVHFMFSGAEGMQSALCGMYSLLGGRSAPHR
jgi:hypothetical protein